MWIFLLVSIDTPGYVPEVEDILMSLNPDFRNEYFSNDLTEFSLGIDANFLDLQETFRNHYQKTGENLHFTPRKAWATGNIPINFGHEGHWNYFGHEVVGQALASKIKKIENSTGIELNDGNF